MDRILAVTVGFISGVTWEHLANKPHNNFPTLVKSRFINFQGKTIHLHHWPWYVLLSLLIFIWAIRTGREDHPATIMLISALLGALVYGFAKFPSWLSFIK